MNEKPNIATLARGALIERGDIEINHVLENIYDKNTDWRKSRKVTLTLEFKAMDQTRESVKVDLQAKKLRYAIQCGYNTALLWARMMKETSSRWSL